MTSSSTPCISVITPAYRAEDYIATAVRSATSIDAVEEVLIIEDGSPDRTLDVCLKLQDEESKVTVLRHANGENKGASESRNLGIQKARNSYIAFLDADDYYLPRRFDRDIQILTQSDDIDGVYGALGTAFLTESAETAFVAAKLPAITTISSRVEPDCLPYVLLGVSTEARGHIHLDTLTVHKRIFERSGVFDPQLVYGEDTDLITRMALQGSLVSGNIYEPVAMRGVHDHNRVTDGRAVDRGRHQLWDKLHRWGIEHGMPRELVELCHKKSISWKTHELSFLNALTFLMAMKSNYPEVWNNPEMFRQSVVGVFGENKLTGAICRLHRLTTNQR